MTNVTTFAVRPGRLPNKLPALLDKVRPMFNEWLAADNTFQKSTAVVAAAVRKAFDLYSESSDAGRVGFARLFDATIPEDAKSRDLASNATYNRLNYLVDKIGKTSSNPHGPRPTVTERRQKVQKDWTEFRKKHDKQRKVDMREVEQLVVRILAELWPEEKVKELIAA